MRNNIKIAIAALEQHIKDNVAAIDVEKEYDETLEENYSFVSVGGPFVHMSPPRVLKKMDECAYSQGRNDYADSRCKGGEWMELEDEYYCRYTVEKEKEVFISDYQDTLRADDMEEDEITEIVDALECLSF